jgi:hypoxia up-regulated 1
MPRKPEVTFSKLFRMLGKHIDHPHMEELEKHYFPFEFEAEATEGRTSIKLEDTFYHPEELLAMMMQHAKDMTKNYGGKVIKDCVLTVPSSFTQHERLALYTAAAISDLNVLSLVEENTAAALNFAMDRNFDTPTTAVFYNMGSSSTQVTIVVFSGHVVKEGGKNKTISQFEVIGKAWDSSLGGFSFDIALAELLADRFNDAWAKKLAKKAGTDVAAVMASNDVRKNVRAMTRLRLEAVKVKEVLSANAEYPVKIEQLHADADLVTKVTRLDLEQHVAGLLAQATVPIETALKMANITLQNVDVVEIIGGGVRVPSVKRALQDFFAPAKLDLGQHLNGDEAMALGAALRGANLSTAFRVRKIGMQDISSFGVVVELSDAPEVPSSKSLFESVSSLLSGDTPKAKESAPATDGEEGGQQAVWSKRTLLFPRKSPVPAKVKTVTFTHEKDIICRLEYDTDAMTELLLPHGTNKLIAMYNISGIAQFVRDNAEKGVLGTPKVHLSFTLDASGLVSLSRAEVSLEVAPEETDLTGSIVGAENATESTGDATGAASESSNSTEDSSASASSTSKKEGTKAGEKDKLKKKDRVLRKTLDVAYNYEATTPPQWTPDHIESSRSKLLALDAIDRQRREREAALNSLEGYMYLVKNKLIDNAEELSSVSTDEVRQSVVSLCDETEEWLYGEGRDEGVAAYQRKEGEIKALAEPIFRRHSELTERPAVVAKTRKQIEGIRKRVKSWPETMPQITTNETEKMLGLVDKVEAWLDEREAEQSKKSAFDEPAFFSSDVAPQMKPVASLLDRLLKKPKPIPPKVTQLTACPL